MQKKNVILLVIDRLQAGMLGAYGNTWIRTPHFDHLAAESFLFDSAFAVSPDLEDAYRAIWQGLHAAAPDEAGLHRPTLMKLLSEAGWRTTLLTDDPSAPRHPLAGDFSEVIFLEADSPAAAHSVAESETAHVLAEAVGWMESAPQPYFLAVHSRGMAGAWDAPRELREQFADPEDPQPPDILEVPSRRLSEDYDPDELLGIMHSYAGQVALVDECLGGLLSALTEGPLVGTTLLIVTSPRGFPLGEHLAIGDCGESLHNETIHVPFLLRFPDGLGAMARSNALVQPMDLPRTILDWCGINSSQLTDAHSLLPIVRDEASAARDRALMVSEREWAIRTPAWLLKVALPLVSGQAELFAKPSDHWEVNEVADRCPEVVTALRKLLLEFERTRQTAQASALQEILVEPVD